VAWYPGALRKEITKWRTPINGPRGFVFHVAVSEAASLYGYFSGAAVCSHFYVRKDGVVEQYVDTRFRAPANYQGNPTLISVETQGGVNNAQGEPWTPQQVEALAQLSRWVHQTHGITLSLMPNSKPSSVGFGYHRQGIDPWRVSGGEKWSTSAGKICPGNGKIGQIPSILTAAGGVTVPVDNGTPAQGNGGTARDYLMKGDRGAGVSELQTLLNREGGFGLTVDGIFGAATDVAVRRYQSSRGLTIDGLAGPATLGALRSSAPAVNVPVPPANTGGVITLKKGSTGAKVRELQVTLKNNYPAYAKKLVVDGIFGPATDGVVREFQRRSGLAVDGIVGPATAKALGISLDVTSTPQPPAPAPAPAPAPSGPGLAVDGVFGADTTRALQAALGVAADGIVGKQTIRALQNHLNARGHGLVVDGIWGAATTTALQHVLNAGSF
jgi:peptidoglycan hydrolase-like protein with peptidoglycan-binding domain